MSRRRFREHLPFTPRPERHFRWRGREVSRIEGFTDAVFAFAVTLLIVALEVPHTFKALVDVLREFPPFVAAFAVLMMFWRGHYKFHRRYGLDTAFTHYLTLAILLLVLFSVYPLKFLFSAWLSTGPHRAHLDSLAELKLLFQIYSLGFGAIWMLYAVLQHYALGKRDELQLSPIEVVVTRESYSKYVILVGLCGLSFLFATLETPPRQLPGYIFFLIAPLFALNGWWHGRQVRAMLDQERTPPLAA